MIRSITDLLQDALESKTEKISSNLSCQQVNEYHESLLGALSREISITESKISLLDDKQEDIKFSLVNYLNTLLEERLSVLTITSLLNQVELAAPVKDIELNLAPTPKSEQDAKL